MKNKILKLNGKTMKYLSHLYNNWKVAAKAFLLMIFHFLHGLIPCKFTDHNYWNFCLSEHEKKWL